MTTELAREREAIRPLISRSDPGDALTAYYGLYHSAALTHLHVHRGEGGLPDGFLAVCTTGADLFRPLVVMRGREDGVLRSLMQQALVPGRPYYIVAPLRYTQVIEKEINVSERRIGAILALDLSRFEPIVNVLVVPAASANGGLRFEIRSQDRVMAAAGTNWKSPDYAEIYVYREPEARGRGWGKSVAAACTAALMAEGIRPLYVVAEGDESSLRLASELGYRDTERREFIATGARHA
jgi:ribosomal protein S18 acetylase RimI-like enzyme